MPASTRIAPILAAALLAAGPLAAETPEVLPEACETTLALSAAPEHLQEGAALYLFRRDGYLKVREGSNGFTCLVNRDHPRVLKPVCFDAEGTRTIVPKILRVGELLAAGTEPAEIERRIDAAFAAGELVPPARSGVAYMLSDYNRPWDPQAGRLGWFPPHLMFYAPGLTSADVGFDPGSYLDRPYLPFVGYQGPHGFFIVRTARESRPWEHPLPECPAWVMGRHGELPPEARQFDFWLGEWDVNLRIRQEDGSWPDSVQAVARIHPVLDGKAVLELWDSEPIKGYSLRYFDTSLGRWVLWLNWPGANRSGGSALEGSFRHGRGEFFTEGERPDGTTRIARYTFSDVTPESLRWDDAYSEDGGTTWTHGWRMEFTRRARRAALPADGGPAHTYHDGGRCDLEPFRRFEALTGRRQGVVEERDAGGGWRESPAELVGYRILDGCAVLAALRWQRDGTPFESLSLLTWNTYAETFEEDVLDSAPDSPLHVLYGAETEGRIELTRGPRSPVEGPARRHRWRLDGDAVTLEVAVPDGAGAADPWRPTLRARFPG